jgi:hypothetical protein
MVGPRMRSVRTRTVWVGLAATRILLWAALGFLLIRFVTETLTAAQFSAAQALIDAPAPGLVLTERADRPLDEASLRALGPTSQVSDVLVRVHRVDGHMRIWSDADRVTVTALSIKTSSVRAANAALQAAVEAAAAVREDVSSTEGVTDAHGFVVQGSTAQDWQVRRVVLLRRARFLFMIAMDARSPAQSDAATLNALVLAQGGALGQDAAWRPEGRVTGGDLAGSYLTYLVFAVLLARGLLAVDDLLADRQARWRRRIALLKHAENQTTGPSSVRSPSDEPPSLSEGSVGVTVIDVTAMARARRDIARAVWLCGAFALLMLLPIADRSAFPGSLAALAAAVPTAAVAVGLRRRSRVAASLLLVVLAIASPGLALLLLLAAIGSRQQPLVAALALVLAFIGVQRFSG